MCESTAAEAVDDMQRMNVADRMKNGERSTEGGGATHTKGAHSAQKRTTTQRAEGHTKRPTGGRRGTHIGNTQTY